MSHKDTDIGCFPRKFDSQSSTESDTSQYGALSASINNVSLTPKFSPSTKKSYTPSTIRKINQKNDVPRSSFNRDSKNSFQKVAKSLSFKFLKRRDSSGRDVGEDEEPTKNKTTKSKYNVKFQTIYGEEHDAYINCSVPRGNIFICNFSSFDDKSYSKREGSEFDFNDLKDVLLQLGYKGQEEFLMNGYITKKDCMEKLEKFSQSESQKEVDSCIVAIMSHGYDESTIVSSDGEHICLESIYTLFENQKTPFLNGKPKIFILNYCRESKEKIAREREEERKKFEELKKLELKERYDEHIRRIEDWYMDKLSDLDATWQEKHKRESIGSTTCDVVSPTYVDTILRIDRGNSFNSRIRKEYHSLIDSDTFTFSVKSQSDLTASTTKGSLTQVTKTDMTVTKIQNRPISDFEDDGKVISYGLNPQPDSLRIRSPTTLKKISDIFVIFSTSPGDVSLRDPKKGSLMIQALCYSFSEFAYRKDLNSLINKAVKYLDDVLQKDLPPTAARQTCERTSRGFDKKFFFNPLIKK